MKLSKALKLKNKKVTEYNESIRQMTISNSYDIDAKKIYNAKEISIKAEEQMNDIVKLKTAIHLTSEPIRSKIFKLGELKSYLGSVGRINTQEGPVKTHGYSTLSTITYVVDINELEKVAKVKAIQDEIDSIQEEIDTFNATTEVVGY